MIHPKLFNHQLFPILTIFLNEPLQYAKMKDGVVYLSWPMSISAKQTDDYVILCEVMCCAKSHDIVQGHVMCELMWYCVRSCEVMWLVWWCMTSQLFSTADVAGWYDKTPQAWWVTLIYRLAIFQRDEVQGLMHWPWSYVVLSRPYLKDPGGEAQSIYWSLRLALLQHPGTYLLGTLQTVHLKKQRRKKRREEGSKEGPEERRKGDREKRWRWREVERGEKEREKGGRWGGRRGN